MSVSEYGSTSRRGLFSHAPKVGSASAFMQLEANVYVGLVGIVIKNAFLLPSGDRYGSGSARSRRVWCTSRTRRCSGRWLSRRCRRCRRPGSGPGSRARRPVGQSLTVSILFVCSCLPFFSPFIIAHFPFYFFFFRLLLSLCTIMFLVKVYRLCLLQRLVWPYTEAYLCPNQPAYVVSESRQLTIPLPPIPRVLRDVAILYRYPMDGGKFQVMYLSLLLSTLQVRGE